MGIKSIAGVSVVATALAGGLAVILVSGTAIASSDRARADQPVAKSAGCMYAQITRSEIINDHTLKIQDMTGRTAILSLTGSCLKERSDGVALQLAPLVDSICRPADVSVIARPTDIAPLNCNVTSIQFVRS
jgi:hypothetical protein